MSLRLDRERSTGLTKPPTCTGPSSAAAREVDHPLGRVQPEHLRQHFAPVAVPAAGERLAPLLRKPEADVGIGQRVARDERIDLAPFGGLVLEELPAGGNVEEEILDRHHRSLRRADRRGRLDAPVLRRQAHAMRLGMGPADERQARHGGDGSQRLAAETERAQRIQIRERREFARRVALQRQSDFGRIDPVAVVGDGDFPASAVFRFDRKYCARARRGNFPPAL